MSQLFDMSIGEIDENRQYYTEEMFQKDAHKFLLFLLLKKGLVTKQEAEIAKTDFMAAMNKELINEIKKLRER